MELLFPLWDVPTRELANQMLGSGLRARLSCVDPRAVPAEWAGRDYDSQLLAELPASVDPCAENGEFHTFVYAGPMFRKSIRVVNGETVERDGFIFADLLEASAAANPTTSAGPATGPPAGIVTCIVPTARPVPRTRITQLPHSCCLSGERRAARRA